MVEAVSDRVGVMQAGKTASVDETTTLRTQWTDETVADLPVHPQPVAHLDNISDVTVEADRVTVPCRDSRAKGHAIAPLEPTCGVAVLVSWISSRLYSAISRSPALTSPDRQAATLLIGASQVGPGLTHPVFSVVRFQLR